MPYDALTISSICHELAQQVKGGRIQGVLVAAPLTISLEVYRPGSGRSFLLLSAHPQHARVLLTPTAPSRDPQQTPTLLLLLRKYVRGGTIIGISQPPNERVLSLSIAKRWGADKHQEYHFDPYFMDKDAPGEEDEAEEAIEEPDSQRPAESAVELVIELMGNLSNIILVSEDGSVMDSMKRVSSSINRYRVTLPNHRYTAPPPQDKRDPMQATINVLSLELMKAGEQDAGAQAWKALVGGFLAISPPIAREIVFRTLGNTSARALDVASNPTELQRLLDEMQGLLGLRDSNAWEPTVAWKQVAEDESRPMEFAPYRLTHLEAGGASLVTYKTISEAASRYFEASESVGGHSALKAQVRGELAELKSRDERRLSALREQLARAASSDILRRKGEFLLGYMHTLKPGQQTLVLQEEGLTIDLDPSLTPVENAQALFREYHKARSAQEGLPALVAGAEMRVAFLDELATSLDLATAHDDIRAVQAEVRLANHPIEPGLPNERDQQRPKGTARKGQEKVPQPLRTQTTRGAQLLIGRTARQNDTATFRLAAPDDLWFHARGAPGSHVILRTSTTPISEEDIEEAASYAAAYSKLRQEAAVDVIYTEKRFVRKVANAPPGFVTYKNERVIRVAPAKRK